MGYPGNYFEIGLAFSEQLKFALCHENIKKTKS